MRKNNQYNSHNKYNSNGEPVINQDCSKTKKEQKVQIYHDNFCHFKWNKSEKKVKKKWKTREEKSEKVIHLLVPKVQCYY